MRFVLALFLVGLSLALTLAEDDLKTQLNALVPDADVQDEASGVYAAPLKAKLFQLQKKLEKELEELLKQKDDLAQALAKAKLQLENAKKLLQATKNELHRRTPEKDRSDYEVISVRASLEVMIRASKRQLKLNNLEREALFAQIKFIDQAQVLRSRIVGERPNVALISVEDLEAEVGPAANVALFNKKETVLSTSLKKTLEEMQVECQKRLKELDEQDAANSVEIKKLQSELKEAIEQQTKSTATWKTAKFDNKKAESGAARYSGMYSEMLRISKKNNEDLDHKIQVVKKELELVGIMVDKIDNYNNKK